MNNDYLYHHGIKGMKWGVRRTDAQLGHRPAGKVKQLVDARTDKLTESYISKGFGPNDSRAMAEKRVKTEKFIAAAGAATVAAAGAYVAKNQLDYRLDKEIKAGTQIQRMIGDHNNDLGKRGLYVTTNKSDSEFYYGSFGGRRAHIKATLEPSESLKIPSRKKAEDTMLELMKNDKEFKTTMDGLYKEWFGDRKNIASSFYKQNKMDMINTMNNYVSGKSNPSSTERKHMYDAFNIALARPDVIDSGIASKYYDALQAKGYEALVDVNDKKYSFENNKIKQPTIIFSPAATLKVKGLEEVSKSQVKDFRDKYDAKATHNYVAKWAGKTVVNAAKNNSSKLATGAIGTAVLTYSYKNTINTYRKQHPDSGLSDKEIAELMANENKR